MEQFRINQIANEILTALRKVTSEVEDKVIYAAYILFKKAQQSNLNILALTEKDVPACIARFTKEKDFVSIWNALAPLANVYSPDSFAGVVLHYDNTNIFKTGSFATPNSISTLASLFLRPKKGEILVDIGCALGDYIVEAKRMDPQAEIVGIEQNAHCAEIAQMRAEVLGPNVSIHLGDAFNDTMLRADKTKKIFCNPPFNLKLLDLGPAAQQFIDSSDFVDFGFTPATRAEWVFAALQCASMGAKGKAVTVMPVGALFAVTKSDAVRKIFVKNGLIESVVLLPKRMFPSSGISTAMVVFSKGNKSVRFVDASCLYESSRQYNYFETEHFDVINDAFLEDGEFSKSIACKDLLEGDCTLSPDKYVAEQTVIENATPLGLLITSIKRGASIQSKQIDSIKSQEPTQFRYLSLANISNGMLNEPLPSLKEIPANNDRFCIKKRSLVFAKVGSPFKMAVVEPNDDYQILVNGNLYIIEFDEDQVNPYYVKAVLESEWGANVLQQKSQGSVLPNISVETLLAISIPLPKIKEQNELVEKYISIQTKIKKLKTDLAKKMDELTDFCNNIVE